MASILQFLNIADAYERKARFLPAFIVVLPVVAFTMSLQLPNEGWVMKLIVAGGAGSALVVALAHMASAAGNRFGRAFWEKRGGMPTNRWLRAADTSHSRAQKRQWYMHIQKLTGLDIQTAGAASPEEECAVIEDAIRQLRYQFRGKAAARMLEKHNIDYGFARNLAGMRWLFVGSSLLGALGCTIAWKFDHGSLTGLVLTLCLLTYAIIMSLWLPTYVERCADRYAESFFSLPVFTTNKKSANSENAIP